MVDQQFKKSCRSCLPVGKARRGEWSCAVIKEADSVPWGPQAHAECEECRGFAEGGREINCSAREGGHMSWVRHDKLFERKESKGLFRNQGPRETGTQGNPVPGVPWPWPRNGERERQGQALARQTPTSWSSKPAGALGPVVPGSKGTRSQGINSDVVLVPQGCSFPRTRSRG